MAIWSVIKLSDVRSGFRIDSEFYRNDYLEKDHKLSKLKTHRLGHIARVTDGEHGSVIFVKSGIKYLTAEHIKQGFIDANSARFISEAIDKRNERARVREGDVLISIKGTLGEVGLAESSLLPANMNRDVAIVKLINKSPTGAYLTSFLRSSFGIYQLAREGSGGVQQMITLERLRDIRIPVISDSSESEITSLYLIALRKLAEFKRLSLEVNQMLESALGLDKLIFKNQTGYTTQASTIESSRRFDPEHFYPAFQNFRRNLPSGVTLTPLSSNLSFCQRGKQPAYKADGLPVINSKHVQPNQVILEGNRKAAPNPFSALQIRNGDTLLNGTGRGTLGRAAPYLEESPAVPDNHVTILRSPNLDPVYLSLYLNSPAGQMQVEMHQRGTSGQLELYPFDIRKFLIWDAPEGLQKELRQLHDQAAAAERKSRELLETAKTRVEQLIEEAARNG